MAKKKESYKSNDVTFVNSKNVPFQRWYPYIEGYSPDFVTTIIKENVPSAQLIYEPFAGTGTTLFASDSLNIPLGITGNAQDVICGTLYFSKRCFMTVHDCSLQISLTRK